MQFRTLLTFVNFGTIAAAIVVLLAFPQFASIAFYVLLGWMVGSIVLLYGLRSSRPMLSPTPGSPGTTTGATISADVPLASAASGQHSSALGFCLYCAAPVSPGTMRCPACDHPLPHFA